MNTQNINHEKVHCENCDESVIFHLKRNEEEITIGLSTILECITFAIQVGDLPKLPMSWLADADAVCGTYFTQDDRNCYSDYK